MNAGTYAGTSDAPQAHNRAGVGALLQPRSVAIVGATPRVESLGGRPILNLRTQGFDGRIYPINPRHQEILGYTCYPSLSELPEAPDVVMVMVGPDRLFASLDEAVQVGAKVALVFGAGFAEVQGEGIERQRQLATYADKGLRICGPNCNGVFSVSNKTALGFMPSFEFSTHPGNVALIAQSGNVATCVSSRGTEMGVGFSTIVATGNEADLEATDFVEYLIEDSSTEVFALFIEGFKDPARFLGAAERALRRGKPIIVMKMGRSAASQRVALSHTGAMTGSHQVLTGALRQKGVIVVDSLDELWGTAALFAQGKRPRSGHVAVASLSGGVAGVIVDACDQHGVPLASFTALTEQGLANELPGVANLANPLDMTGQVVNEPDCWKNCIQILAADAGVDVLISALSITAGQIERRFASDVLDLSRGPVMQVCIWGSSMPPGAGIELLKAGGIPLYTNVDDAVSAIAAWNHYWQTRTPRLAALDNQARDARSHVLALEGIPGGWSMLEHAGIPMARHAMIRQRHEIEEIATRLKFPLALKIASSAASHKTEINALRLNIRSVDEAFLAFDELQSVAERHLSGMPIDGYLVQEMIAGKREIIVGLKHEPGIGYALLVGLGGIFSEVLNDVSIRIAPITRFDANEMIGEIRARKIFDGIRGLEAIPRSSLSDVLLGVSGLVDQYPGAIAELDINPLIILDDGSACIAVDVLVSLLQQQGNTFAPMVQSEPPANPIN